MKKEINTNFLITSLIIIIILLVSFILVDKLVFSNPEKSVDENNSNGELNNEHVSNETDEDDENQLTLSSMVGLFEGSINGTTADGYPMTAYFYLNIKEDHSCEFSRGVSGGSGWSASGNCVLEDSKIILTSNEFQNDAEISSEIKQYTFVVNSVDSISYADGLGNVVLKKQ